jgi:hypothetical protein
MEMWRSLNSKYLAVRILLERGEDPNGKDDAFEKAKHRGDED